MIYLPDVNILLALFFSKHSHNTAAVQWLETVPDNSVGLCRLTQLGFLRISTNEKVFGAEALTQGQAWGALDQLMTDSRITFIAEPVDLDVHFRRYSSSGRKSTNQWTDAYLAAFAKAVSGTLVTFDRGLVSHVDADLVVLQ